MERRQIGPRKAAHYRATGAETPIAPVVGCCLLAICIALAGCGRKDTRAAPPAAATPAPQRDWQVLAPSNPAAANAVLMRAISLVGTPYRYGGNTPEGGFDCSGLVNYVFRDMLDLRLPRTSRELAAYQGPKISPDRLAAADGSYWRRNYSGARRVLQCNVNEITGLAAFD